MAKIFDVSVDELLSDEPIQQNVEPEETVVEPVADEQPQSQDLAELDESQDNQAQQTVEPQQNVVLAVCEHCNKPIFDGNQIVRVHTHNDKQVWCKSCHEKEEKRKHNNAVSYGVSQRQKSWGWGIAAGLVAAIIALVITMHYECDWKVVLGVTLGATLVYPFVACLLLRNNFIGEMVAEIASWGFVTFPGIIFELDLDGILWLLTVKLAFWILGFALATGALILGIIIGIVVSIFVYPFALIKSYSRPEEAEVF